MAVFLINICKFNGCGITFPSLGDLIQHIEDTHIDYDPKVVEQKEQAQPACLPLSYVLRFISDAARKESPFLGTTGVELKRKLAIKHHSYSLSSSNRSNTPTGSELDEDEMIVSESEDSNDSWTTEEFSSEFIMRYGSRHSGSSNGTPGNEKPFACPVPGCKKRYKNVNGIKYHSKNGHKKDGKVRKGYKCHCGKSYKTAQGLKGHALLAHNASPDNVTNVMVRSTSPSQSLGSLSPSSISNMSSSNGSCNNINQSTNSNCITQAPPPPSLQQQQQQQQQQSTQIINSSSQVAHLTNGGSIHQHTPVATTNSINQSIAATTVAATNHLMRSNIGLISIKSSNKTNTTNLIAANVTASKILKLAAASAAANSNNNGGAGNNGMESSTAILENGKLKFEACTTATTSTTTPTAKTMTLPNLVNLGILTPATSPNNKSQQHTTTFQTSSGATVTTCGGVSVLSSLNLNSSSSSSCSASTPTSQSLSNQGNINSSSSSLSINHNPNNNSNNLLDNNTTSLPLTPISPNVVQQTKTVTVASVATGTTGGGGLTISTGNGTSSIVGSIHLATATGGLEET